MASIATIPAETQCISSLWTEIVNSIERVHPSGANPLGSAPLIFDVLCFNPKLSGPNPTLVLTIHAFDVDGMAEWNSTHRPCILMDKMRGSTSYHFDHISSPI